MIDITHVPKAKSVMHYFAGVLDDGANEEAGNPQIWTRA